MLGRALGLRHGPADPPLEDRHGIPNLGPCIRCNLQIEGSGVSADDVVDRRRRRRRPATAAPIDAGQGRRHPRRPRRRLRAAQPQGPPRQRARHLRARDRRLPARPLQDLLRRRVRRAHVRRGPRPDAELRGRRQRRLGPVPGRRRRHRRPARHEHLPRVPLQPGDPLLRLPPQRRRLLGHRRQRHPHRPQQLLRQRARLHDRRLHGAGPPRLPAGLGPDREQQLLLEQLQSLRRRARTSTPTRPGAGRHGPVDRGRQRQRRPQQPLLRQLAPRHDAVRGARPIVCGPAGSTRRRSPGCNPTEVPPRRPTATSSTAT